MTTYPMLSVVVPARDEACNLPTLMARIALALEGHCRYEVVLVDDCSSDDTATMATELSQRYPLLLVRRDGPPGKGYALVEGFARCRGDIVCMIDADLQYPPEEIPAMVALVRAGAADAVVARRTGAHTTVLRRLVSWSAYHALQALHGLDVDVQSGLKVIRREVLDRIALEPTPWAVDLELLLRARDYGYVITGHDIRFDRRHVGHTKVRLGPATWQIMRNAVALRIGATWIGTTWIGATKVR